MKLSARTRYAARILLELAKNQHEKPMSATVLSQHTGVSAQFVEQILKPLKQKGLTASVRGASGGHKLARPAEAVTLGEVVRLMEGGIKLSVCCGEKAEDCPRKENCLIRSAWVDASEALERELDAISLASLLKGGQTCPVELTATDRRKGAQGKREDPAKVPAAASASPLRRSPARMPVRRRAKT